MSDRLPSGVLASALLRRANDAGGMAMVRAKGHPQAGTILLILFDRGRFTGCVEQGRDAAGRPALIPTGPAESATPQDIDVYWLRRRARDPDLWVIDLDIPSAQRFAADTILSG